MNAARSLYSVFFGPPGSRFERMAHALSESAAEHCPDWTRRIERIEAPEGIRAAPFTANTAKLAMWAQAVCDSPDGAELLLIDSDTLIVGPIDDAFDPSFDIAFTRKQNTKRLPINGGVVFVRVSDRTRKFFKVWQSVNDWFYVDESAHKPFELRFGGINQAALGYLIEQGELTEQMLDVHWHDCAVWNNCYDPLWRRSEGARIVHYKSALRRALFNRGHRPRHMQKLIEVWEHYEKRSCSSRA